MAEAIKNDNNKPKYAKNEKPSGYYDRDTEDGYYDWDTEDDADDWNTEQSGSDDSDTEKSGPIDYCIRDNHYDDYSASTTLGPEPRPRWCDVEESDEDDYAGMQSLIDSDDDDRPHDLLSDETDEEEVAATDEYWRSFQPASRRTDNPILLLLRFRPPSRRASMTTPPLRLPQASLLPGPWSVASTPSQ